MSYTLKIIVAPSGKPYVCTRLQSPDLCDLMDRYGYDGYRSDYRDVVTGNSCLCFDPADDVARLQRFVIEAQPLVDSAEKYLREEQEERSEYARQDRERFERQYAAHENQIKTDAENIKNLSNFTGGKKIIFTISTEYDDISEQFWIGKTGTCLSFEDVSPNASRSGTGRPRYVICDHSDPIEGNFNRNIVRYFGWRGTSNDSSCHAHGVRMVEKIVEFKNHCRVYLSQYNRDYAD